MIGEKIWKWLGKNLELAGRGETLEKKIWK